MQEEIKKEITTPETVEQPEVKEEKSYITIDDFQKVEIKVGTIISVDVVEGADKLYILKVDLGEEVPRQILSGIREYKQPEDLAGKQFPFVTNLAPRMLRGYESQGMILAGSDEEGLALLNPTQPLVNGTRLR
jgi:methionyl-tRNA synthetase